MDTTRRHDGMTATTANAANTTKGASSMGSTIKGTGITQFARFARLGMAALVALALLIPIGAESVSASAPAKPAFCNGTTPGLAFRWVALFVEGNKPNYTNVWNSRNTYNAPYNPSLKPGDSFYIMAFVTDCAEGANENNNSHALFEYRGANGQRHDGPSPSFTRVAGNQYEGLYVAKVTLFGFNPCDCDRIGLKELYMGDRAGGHTFTVNNYGWIGNAWGTYRRS